MLISLNIVTTPTISVNNANVNLCSGQIATVTATSSATSYTWNPGNLSGASQTGLSAGIYTVNITDAGLCAGSGTILISQPTLSLSAAITATTATGCGTSTGGATVTASGGTAGYTYAWIPSGGTTAGISNLGTGNNTVVVTDANSCSVTAVANITVVSIADVTIIPSSTIIPCFTGSVSLTANSSSGGPYTYVWSPSVPSFTGSTFVVSNSGTYTVVAINTANSCTASATQNITEESINASFVANPTQGFVPLPVTFTNTSVNPIGTTYNWNFGNTTTSTSTASTVSTIYDTQGVFPVTLISTNGSCQDTAIIYIKVELLSSIIVPNVFTPNNDGSNDIFTLQAVNIGEINITIFDRWGLKMFEVVDSGNIKWDGKAPNGKAVPDGTYFYVIKAEGLDGKKYDLNGSINIFK
jgi:gliding motility-associated-like protein